MVYYFDWTFHLCDKKLQWLIWPVAWPDWTEIWYYYVTSVTTEKHGAGSDDGT